jgi:hypothetical protein
MISQGREQLDRDGYPAREPKSISSSQAAHIPARVSPLCAVQAAAASTGIEPLTCRSAKIVQICNTRRWQPLSTTHSDLQWIADDQPARASSPARLRSVSPLEFLGIGPVIGILCRIGLFAVGVAHGAVLCFDGRLYDSPVAQTSTVLNWIKWGFG